MKKYTFILLGFMIITIFSCTKDFTDINQNPNNPSTAPATNTLGYAIQSLAYRFGANELFYPAAFVGHVANGLYNTVNRYGEFAPNTHWNNMYVYVIKNLNRTITKSEKDTLKNLKAAAIVLKAYAYQMLVDAYGPIPYWQVDKMAEGITQPEYNNERDIYLDLLTQLKTANSLFNNNKLDAFGNGDLIYNGDYLKWKKFCNSLRLRLAIRISKIDPTTAALHISEILNDPTTYPVISSNTDNAILKFPGGYFQEPWSEQYKSINDIRIAKPIVDALVSLNDPRLPIYALKPGSEYIGLEVGGASTTTTANVGDLFMKNLTGSVYFLKYSEVEFIRAEAAMKGYISTAGAQAAYENAIKASLSEFGIVTADINTYLANPSVAWASGDYSRLYTQKWISLFRQSWEAWAEMRRTDVPALPPSSFSVYAGHNRTPFRLHYPTDEQSLNKKNIPTFVNETDLYWGYKIWWDTRTGVQ